MNPLFRIDGKTAIVTGGAGLIGREFCRVLAENGAICAVVDINGEKAFEVAEEITSSGLGALSVETDISCKDSVTQMVEKVLDRTGRVDILVNNAAINPQFDVDSAGWHRNSFEEFPIRLWEQSLAVDLTGMFLVSQAVAIPMLENKSGVLVNVCSTYGIVGPDQRLYQSGDPRKPIQFKPVVYSVTKSAVVGFTKYLATYWATQNIRVNALTPGGVLNRQDDEFVERYCSRTPLGRMARKDEYCGALLFLASDASSYMTGSNLIVDGGWTAW